MELSHTLAKEGHFEKRLREVLALGEQAPQESICDLAANTDNGLLEYTDRSSKPTLKEEASPAYTEGGVGWETLKNLDLVL